MIDLISILIILIIVAGGVGTAVFLVKKEIQKLQEDQKDDTALNLIKQDLDSLQSKFDNNYQKISKELGRIEEIGHAVEDFQDLFKSAKVRGGLGEEVLKDSLRQVLPQDKFELQYKFEGNQQVDAVIETDEGLIPIDSKFPMESFKNAREEVESDNDKKAKQGEFKRAVKKNVRSIAKKYILPDQGTVDFALMYIPSEPAYHDITMNMPELMDYGHEKKVYFVSPNTFYYFLKIVMIGLEGAKIEEASKKILEGLKAVKNSSKEFEDELGTLSTHVNNAQSTLQRVKSKYEELDSKIKTLTSLKIDSD